MSSICWPSPRPNCWRSSIRSPAGRALAEEKGVRWFASFAAMAAEARPEGVIVATPNQLHVANGLECIAAGIPALVEKPLADDVGEATKLVGAAEAAGVPLLTGHHRRHNPLMRQAKEAIDTGRLGRIVAIHGMCWFHKPDDYFEVDWRRRKGAGPVFLNLIHDVDDLRYLCGDVATVQAQETSAFAATRSRMRPSSCCASRAACSPPSACRTRSWPPGAGSSPAARTPPTRTPPRAAISSAARSAR